MTTLPRIIRSGSLTCSSMSWIWKLGFEGAQPEATGRPAYHPATLLKIYIYGYLNRIQSSRRLERETQRNVELIWLTGRLMPDFKTIADFRKDNGKAIRRVCREFVVLCRSLNLFSEAIVAIDGSKFKAVNNRDKNFTRTQARGAHRAAGGERRAVSGGTGSCRSRAQCGDRRACAPTQGEDAAIKEQMQRLGQIGTRMQAAPDRQISLTDPGCPLHGHQRPRHWHGGLQRANGGRHQASSDRGPRGHQPGHDRQQPSSRAMAQQAQVRRRPDQLTALADRGYFKSEQIRNCEQNGIDALVPNPLTSNNNAAGPLRQARFRLHPPERRVPHAGRRTGASMALHDVEHGMTLHKYWSSACPQCRLKAQCTPSDYRRIARWEHEDVLERMQERLDRTPRPSRLRRQTVEHVFGTLKAWMGATHFLTKTLPRVSTEMSSACAGLQLQTSDADRGRSTADEGDERAGINSLRKEQEMKPKGRLQGAPARDNPEELDCAHA